MANRTDLNKYSNLALNNISYSKDVFSLEWVDNYSIKISPFLQNIEIYKEYRRYLDGKTSVINIYLDNGDNIPTQLNSFYMLYAHLNLNDNTIESYKLYKQPKAITFKNVTFTKGSTVLLASDGTNINNFHQFEQGARCLVYYSQGAVGTASEQNNLGYISNIMSYNQMEVILDNDGNYGRNFTANGVTIIQLDKFTAKKYNSSTNNFDVVENTKLLTSCVRIDGSGFIKNFEYVNKKVYFSVKQILVVSQPTVYNANIYLYSFVPPTAYLTNFIYNNYIQQDSNGSQVENSFRNYKNLNLYNFTIINSTRNNNVLSNSFVFKILSTNSIILFREIISADLTNSTREFSINEYEELL